MGRNSLRDYTTADVLNTPIARGGVLPFTQYADRVEFDPSSGWLGSIGRALTAPARAYRGELDETQIFDEGMNFAAWATLGGYMSPKPVNALGTGGAKMAEPQGIRAFHGSPYDFDKFDMSKIGTGEGAQAYGRGLYFAENEGVAKGYRDRLASDADRRVDDPGHMYEVRINADPDSFLNYDLPISQQPPAVRAALEAADLMPYTVVDDAGNRLDFSRGMARAEAERFAEFKGGRVIPKKDADFDAVSKTRMGGGDAAQAEIANALRDAGVPGIKYLDKMSRSAGDGSYNYVVFDDALIDVLRKYGLIGAFGAGAAANAMMQDNGQVY